MEARPTSFLIAVIFGLMTASSIAADFYVATDGSDTWSGTLDEPNATQEDGPFASLERARAAVRELKEKSPERPITVEIRGGTYSLEETIVFGVGDSGTGRGPITYQAYPSESPVFTSAVEITGWEKVQSDLKHLPEEARGHVWVAKLPKSEGGYQRFFTLYDGDGLLPRARSEGIIPLEPETGKLGRDLLYYPDGFARPWSNLQDVELVVRPHHAWIVNILPIASINPKKRSLRTSIPATYTIDELHYLKDTPSCWVENVIDALNEPGEWVRNSEEGTLHLWPRDGARPQGIRAPLLCELIRIEGEIDIDGPADRPVRHLTFRGLTFTQGDSYRIAPGDHGLQHDWEMHDKDSALVRLRGSEDCRIEDCHFKDSGGGAIRIDLHGMRNVISGNHIENIGGTGILLCGYGPGTKDVNIQNEVANNHIHHVGKIYAHSPGIFLWQSGENRVANNLVHHTPYSGIIISGVMDGFFRTGDLRELLPTIRWHEIDGEPWKLSPEQIHPLLHTHDNLIECNEIHHVMEKLADGNGIYIRGAGPDNVIRRNFIHDLVAPTVMQSAIRTDGGQRDTLICENIIYRCVSHGIHLKLNNRAENNIIADILATEHNGKLQRAVYFKLREGPLTGGVIARNIFYHVRGRVKFYDQGRNPRLPPAWASGADTDSNLFFSKKNPAQAQAALEESQAEGPDENSPSTDPLFVDPSKGDFSLMPDSPAVGLGFSPIDMSSIGLGATP